MRKKSFATLVAVLFTVVLAGAACTSTDASKDKDAEATTTMAPPDEETTTTTTPPTETLTDVLTASADLSQFAGLVTMAGLNTNLTDGGPFTVMAPTNAALAEVPAATMTSLQQDPRGALASVLKLHIVEGNMTPEDLADMNGKCVTTLGGQVKITVDGETISFGGATVSDAAPKAAANGSILTVDSVLTTPSADC